VLAQLDEIPGVRASRVDWTGRRFLLELEPDTSSSKIAEAAASALGDGAVVLDADATRAAVADFSSGEAWMRAGETLQLSRHEAHVLARRHGEEAARAIGLSEGATKKLVALFEAELDRAFERTHAAGSGARVQDEISAAVERTVDAAREFLSADELRALEEQVREFNASRGR
jgi:hypothetical protein